MKLTDIVPDDRPSLLAGKLTVKDMIQFLEGAEKYFSNRDTGGEDRAYWANIANAERCRRIKLLLEKECGVRNEQ